MPSSPLSDFPTIHPSFLKHRYNEVDLPRTLKIDLPFPGPLPSWASLPTPPMSGTPSPEQTSDPPQQLAGQRRKREASPPSTTAATQEPFTAASANVNISPLAELTASRYGEPSRPSRPTEQSIMPFPLGLPWESQQTYTATARTPYTQYPAPPLPGRLPQVSPRVTRKTKAHVASACVNCKRKHLRCDEARPCRRCVQSGKEDTCKDVEHKKRGRPPLKPDESSASRLAPGGMSLPPLGPSSSRIGAGSGLVPLLPTPTPARLPFPHYAAPSIASSHAVAQGHFATRPPTFPPIQQSAAHLLSSTPSGAMQQYGYPSQGYGGEQGLPTSPYSNPLFPRRQPPSQQSSLNLQQSSYSGAPFQLPPILPAPPGTNVDPAIAQQHRHTQPPNTLYGQFPPTGPATTQPGLRSESGEREPKRPRMDIQGILGPPK